MATVKARKGAIDVKAVLNNIREIRFVKEDGCEEIEGKKVYFCKADPCAISATIQKHQSAGFFMPFAKAEESLVSHIGGCEKCKKIGVRLAGSGSGNLTLTASTHVLGNKEYVILAK